MICYGLTGKTGAGKTTVADLLRQRGWFVIDGDALARVVTQPGSPVLQQLADSFGSDVLNDDGSLQRKKLVERVNETPQGTAMLNAITHPAIDRLMQQQLEQAEESGFSFCVFDAAALLESPCRARCSKIIVVHAPEQIRLRRIMERDALTPEDAGQRMRLQKDDDYYLSQADIIIRNYPPYSLEEELQKLR